MILGSLEVNFRAPVVSQLCQPLKSEARFQGQPSRFYIWAIHVVDYIYKSWLALQKRLQRQLEGQMRWLSMLRSDTQLVEETGCNLDTIRTHATQVLAQLTLQSAPATSCAFQGEKAQKV